MRSTPTQDEKLRQRLREAVDRFAGGSADLFGRKLGYANGGYIRESLKGPKPVRTAIIERTHKTLGMECWFDSVLSRASAADLSPATAPTPEPWPFVRLSREEWETLKAAGLHRVVEDAAVTKARQLLAELAATDESRKPNGTSG